MLLGAVEPVEPAAANVEIFLTNNTSAYVEVSVTAIGMIFNDDKEYSLVASSNHRCFQNKAITGILDLSVPTDAQGDLYPIVDHISTTECYGFEQHGITQNHIDNHIGYGLYKVIIGQWGVFYANFLDSDYPAAYLDGRNRDIFLTLDSSGTLYWENFIMSIGDTIEIWDQTRIDRPKKPPNINGFKVISNTNIPLGSHTTPGQLFVNLEVQADATVLSGKSFIIQEPGAQILFNANKKLTVNDTLTVNGSSANPVTFDRSGTTGSWNGVRALGLAKIFGSNCLC